MKPTGDSNVDDLRFSLGEAVCIAISGEQGTVIGRAQYTNSVPQYYVRYKAADGRATEAWWPGEALESIDTDIPVAASEPSIFCPPALGG